MPQSGIVRKNNTRQSQDGCGAANRTRSRIVSPEMFPEADMLPQLICFRPSFIGGANDEPDELLKPRVTASNLWARPNNATGGGGSVGNVGGCGGMGDNGDDGRGAGRWIGGRVRRAAQAAAMVVRRSRSARRLPAAVGSLPLP